MGCLGFCWVPSCSSSGLLVGLVLPGRRFAWFPGRDSGLISLFCSLGHCGRIREGLDAHTQVSSHLSTSACRLPLVPSPLLSLAAEAQIDPPDQGRPPVLWLDSSLEAFFTALIAMIAMYTVSSIFIVVKTP